MEDFYIDLILGGENSTKIVRLDIVPFTLIAATTKFGNLSSPLRDRFLIIERLEYYTFEELYNIIKRTSKVYDIKISDEACLELSKRSRGTPRIANKLFRRIRYYATVLNNGIIDLSLTLDSLKKMNINENGLDYTDYYYLNTIINTFKGGPVGLESLSKAIGEDSNTIEDVYEPYLIKEGYIKRTSRGRIALEKAYKLER